METTKDADLESIAARLDNVRGAVESLGCKVPNENGMADEAWTIHDALRAIRADVDALRDAE